MTFRRILKIWLLASAVFAGTLSLAIFSLMSQNFDHLKDAVMDSQRETLRHAIVSEYTNIVDDAFLSLKTLPTREARYKNIVGKSADLKLALEPRAASPLGKPSAIDNLAWVAKQGKEGLSEELKVPLWFGDVNVGNLVAQLDWNPEIFHSASSRSWKAALLTATLIFAGWLVALYFLSRAVILPLMRRSNELARESALAVFSKQVAHDIRSPLSALNMVIGTLNALPEEKRLIIRNATQRINDIANGLLRQGSPKPRIAKTESEAPPPKLQAEEPVMVVALIDMIVSEKRLQFRERLGIEIQADIDGGYGLFVALNGSEFARVISNLVNNSVEAISTKGLVTVTVSGDAQAVRISVVDDGIGIPAELLSRVGERGFSANKLGGSGLGLFHARSTVEAAQGSFAIDSEPSRGTRIEIVLPRVPTPKWFTEKIEIPADAIVVSVDDDQTIHQIWRGRLLSAAGKAPLRHLSFASIEQAERWVIENPSALALFLVDYEFLNQRQSGLDLIERLKIANRTVLVTSRYEELNVKRRAEKLNVKILPKSLAAIVPIRYLEKTERADAILIDDDSLVHMTWRLAAEAQRKKIVCFSTPEEFFESAPGFDRASPLFIDVLLSNGVRGQDVARSARAIGFSKIVLATGLDPTDVSAPDFVERVVGKDPYFGVLG